MSDKDITLLEASQIAEDTHEKILFGLCWDNDKRYEPEIDQLICIAADHLSTARHTLKLASIRQEVLK